MSDTTGSFDNTYAGNRFHSSIPEPVRVVVARFLSRCAAVDRVVYAQHLAQWLAWLADQGLSPFAIEACDVERHLHHLHDVGARPPAAVCSRLGAIVGFYGAAVRDGLLAENPTERVSCQFGPRCCSGAIC